MPGQNKGKVQRNAAEWRALIERYEQSNLGMAEFCTQAGVALNSFKKRYDAHKRAVRPVYRTDTAVRARDARVGSRTHVAEWRALRPTRL